MPTDYKQIAEENLSKYGTEIGRIGEMLLAHRYSDRTHFVYELLQNAEDAISKRVEQNLPRTVTFTLKEDHLEFTHFGIPFDEKHVRAICGIGESTKEKEFTQIGHFGIGFKSVYALTRIPEVHCEDEHFAIESFVRPREVPNRKSSPGQTLFYLPFFDQAAHGDILKRLRLLGHRTLLFLKSIDTIEWNAGPDGSGTFIRQTNSLSNGARKVSLIGETSKEASEESEQWLVFSRDVFKDSGERAGQVEIAYELTRNEEGKDEIVPISDSSLVVFFPTEKETNLGFLVQGPYITTPSRDNIPRDNAWNQHLIGETAELVKESLHLLKDMDLLTVATIQAMPIDASKFKLLYWSGGQEHMFRPIFDAVKTCLTQEELIPKYNGGYISGERARIARTEGLREIISPDQLTTLYNSDKELAWVTGEVTRDKTPLVRSYLMSELDISEVDTDTLLPSFTTDFFAEQSDDWMASFYAFLLDQPSLWRSGGFRGKPIIRTENGEHLIPFDRNGAPRVFLPGATQSGFRTVKQSVCVEPDALKFLQALGLTDPDPVDDVIVNVLPQFSRPMDDQAYEFAIVKIVSAFQTDSSSQKEKLLTALSATAFIRCWNASSKEIRLKRPSEAYIPTENLVLLFSGISTIWFVDDSCNALKGEKRKRLLEACGVRTYLRKVDCEGSLDEDYLLELRKGAGATNASKHGWADFDIEGLREAATRISNLAAGAAESVGIALWKVLVETLREGRETYFKGTYWWRFFHDRWEVQFPAQFVRSLRTIRWIPTIKGVLAAPEEVCFSEVASGIKDLPNPLLQELLNFRPEAIVQLAEVTGVELESIALLKKHGLTTEQLRDVLKKVGLEQEQVGSPSPSPHGSNGNGQETSQGENEPQAGGTEEVKGAIESILGQGYPQPTPPAPGIGGSEFPKGGQRPSTGSTAGTPHGTSGTAGSHTGGQQSTGTRTFFSYIATHASDEEPDPDGLEAKERLDLEESAIKLVLKEEPNLLRTQTNNPGFDLAEKGSNGGQVRWIEVKAMKGTLQNRPVGLSRKQFETAQEHGDNYWLYVVENAGSPSEARIVKIQDPAGKARTFTFDHGWINVAQVSASSDMNDHQQENNQG